MSLHAQVTNKLHTLVTLTEAGVIRAQRPDRLLRTAVTLIRWGATPASVSVTSVCSLLVTCA